MLNSLLSLYIASILGLSPTPANIPGAPNGSATLAAATLSDDPASASKPIKDALHISPIIGARGSIAQDINSGEVLFEKNPDERLKIASITKLMTLLIVLDENKLDDVVTVSRTAAGTPGSTMFLAAGEQITEENLIYGALINSANDAAVALAEHNAGSSAAFVVKMNNKAKELGLTNTHFSNPVGLDDSDNYSSSRDIANLGKYLYHNPHIKKIAKIKNMDVRSVSGNYTHKLESTNKLLDSYLKINGLKTGTTDDAGRCLIAIAENKDGHEIVTVVLNSTDRFGESKILIDWVFRAFTWPNQ
ncbi:MAG: D-alanyl-D-alanine carboxypeptidase [Candidatus Peregrinibacteria bacterium]|nr:D-alanyl-D-alanine carboxypeptidase [Candidatus Peregrinibacteria bacterium]